MTDTGYTIWLTVLSGTGKSTIAQLIEQRLRGRGIKAEILNGDVLRTHLSKGLVLVVKTAISTSSALHCCRYLPLP